MYTKLETESRSQMRYGGDKLIADNVAEAELIPISVRVLATKVYCILEEIWLIADSKGVWRPYKDAIGYAQGIKGDEGDVGLTGPQGEIGPKGEQGDRGLVGLPGRQGLDGIQGIQGEQGDQGIKGDQGDRGDMGQIGLTGARGERGYPGPSHWSVGDSDPDFDTLPDFYINTITRAVFGPKEQYLPKKDISNIILGPKAYSSGLLSLGMKIKIKRAGTITHLKFYKMRDEATLTRKLKIWTEAGVLLREVETANESIAGWQKYKIDVPLEVDKDTVLVVSYGVDGIYGLTNPIPEADHPEFFEYLGSGWSNTDMESFPDIDPTPDIPLYSIGVIYDEKPPIVWPVLGYLASTEI